MIKNNLLHLKGSLPEQVTLVAVSKTKPVVQLMEAYDAGQRDFGENYVQELVEKVELLPKDIRWHFIGHLQSNKVKFIAPFVHLIHGVDSLKLLQEINKQGAKLNRIIPCLLQVYIAKEESKFGFDKNELLELANSELLNGLKNIRVEGLMGMASNTEDENQIASEFKELASIFEVLKNKSSENFNMLQLSGGMSGDYKIAIAAGCNMIRVGSTIFGSRNYSH